MNFIEELEWRGLIHNFTPDLKEELEKGMIAGYVGFDPTASSLHIGNLIPIMLLVHLQRAGHKPIALVGGATGRIGDPSGKDKERSLLPLEVLQANVECFEKQLGKLLDFKNGDNKAQLVNNNDFYKDMNALVFLRDVGKHMTISYMMAKDSVKNRIETGISFTEFSYQLIQGYDHKCLYEQYNCQLQMGGSDQWGNITTGVEFVRKMLGKKAHALTTPLLTKPDGSKYGKSEGGNIWLDATLTSPYQFYQFFLNANDDMLDRLLKTFSLKTKEEIEAILAKHEEAPHLRIAQKAIAEELTIRIHDQESCDLAIKASTFFFNKKMKKEELFETPAEVLDIVGNEIPNFKINKDQLSGHLNLIDFLTGSIIEDVKVLASKGDARRAMKQNALSVNKEKTSSIDAEISMADFIHGKYLMVENGKKNKFLIIAE